jgi:hypothetical protein
MSSTQDGVERSATHQCLTPTAWVSLRSTHPTNTQRPALALALALKSSSETSEHSECPVQRGNFSPKRKTGCPGQAFLVTSSAFGRSDSPEGAKYDIRARTEAAQKNERQRSQRRITLARYPPYRGMSA